MRNRTCHWCRQDIKPDEKIVVDFIFSYHGPCFFRWREYLNALRRAGEAEIRKLAPGILN